jgi:hypothetical protein
MKQLTDPSPRLAAAGAAIAAAASAAGGVIQLTHEQSGETTVVGAVEHLMLVAFSVMLVALVPAAMFLARRVAGSAKPGIVVGVAAVLLATLATISNVRGDDPSFFAAVAVPTNLAIFGSFVAIGVGGLRRGFRPRWIAIGLPLVQLAAIPMSSIGGGLLAAAFWAGVAAWAADADSRRAPAVPAGAAA